MRALLAAGGTGGHIFPAVSVARVFKKRHCDAEVVFAGNQNGLEGRLVCEAGFPLHHVSGRPLPRQLSIGSLRPLIGAFMNLPGALATLRQIRPDVVLGTGGYVSALTVFAAAFLGIPTAILNFDSVPGRTNRILSLIVNRIGITFAAAADHLPVDKCVLTGTPLRKEFLETNRAEARAALQLSHDDQLLLVFGGSQGAHRINAAAFGAAPQLLAAHQRLRIIHICGKNDFAEAQERKTQLPSADKERYQPLDFTDQMHKFICAADVAVCRSGASSIAELTVCGVPMVLVPYPYHADFHQVHNARIVEQAGAATIVLDHQLNDAALTEKVQQLTTNRALRETMAEKSRQFGIPDAAERVCSMMEDITCR